ncbi:hypothetical protein [Botrimarina mediterranea]|uniref:hypothetical protein n=1 Tax=Botrimarina mediterranea TaxID=2528022 RepID=UPI00118D53D1|nr:hypothetical protein K2D_31200 [Planctomycetes bacterium K2D]
MSARRAVSLGVGISAIGLTLLAFALRPKSVESPNTKRDAPARMKLGQVIEDIDSLTLIKFDFVFDGGSLIFGFSSRSANELEGAPKSDVFVFLPSPRSLYLNQEASNPTLTQPVYTYPPKMLEQAAIVSDDDPDYESFVRLIRNAGTRNPTEETPSEEWQEALEIVKAAVVDGKEPRWGGNAFAGYRDLSVESLDVK